MHGRWSKTIIKSKKISIYNKFLWAIMKMNKIKDQEEGIKNAKLFYEAVKLAWGLQVTYCYHDLIYMIKNNYYYDLYESDNGWGMDLGAKNQKDEDVCTLAEILKKDDDEESKEEKKQEEDDDEIKATNELVKELNEYFTK